MFYLHFTVRFALDSTDEITDMDFGISRPFVNKYGFIDSFQRTDYFYVCYKLVFIFLFIYFETIKCVLCTCVCDKFTIIDTSNNIQ